MTPKLTQLLEDAIRRYETAEAYFEQAYLQYRLARKPLDEQEMLVNETRKKIDEEARQAEEQLND